MLPSITQNQIKNKIKIQLLNVLFHPHSPNPFQFFSAQLYNFQNIKSWSGSFVLREKDVEALCGGWQDKNNVNTTDDSTSTALHAAEQPN